MERESSRAIRSATFTIIQPQLQNLKSATLSEATSRAPKRVPVCARIMCARTHAMAYPRPIVKSGNRYQIVMSSRHAGLLSNRYNWPYTALADCQADTPHRYQIVIKFSGTKPSLYPGPGFVKGRYQIVIIERMFEQKSRSRDLNRCFEQMFE